MHGRGDGKTASQQYRQQHQPANPEPQRCDVHQPQGGSEAQARDQREV
jgi:hypothetical protein